MRRFLIIVFLYISPLTMFAQDDIVGKWKTIDDNTGKERSVVEIYKKGDAYFGKLIELNIESGDDPNPICDECDPEDDRYNQLLLGMEIIRDMKKEGDEYAGGNVLDPEEGNIYRCRLWIEDGDLMIRGYIAFFFRTQTWKKF